MPASSARATANSAAFAFASRRNKVVGFDEMLPDAQSASAAGVDFEVGLDLGTVREDDGTGHDGRRTLKTKRQHFAASRVFELSGFMQRECFSLGVDFNDK